MYHRSLFLFHKVVSAALISSDPPRPLNAALLVDHRSVTFITEGSRGFCVCLIVAEGRLAQSRVEIAIILH